MDGTKALIIRPDNEETRKLAAQIIANGGLIAFRTDTFYGLGADPLKSAAVGRIKTLKGREEGKPILVLIADPSDAEPLMKNRPEIFGNVTAIFWPGPLTIVVPSSSALPEEITVGTGSVGLRLPNDSEVRSLVRACGGRLTATSANPSGGEAAKSAAEVAHYFQSAIDLIIDGDDVMVTQPSTVLDIMQSPPRLIREGAISRAQLESELRIQIE